MPSPPKVSLCAIKSSSATSCSLNLAKRKRRPNVISLDDVTAHEVKDWGPGAEHAFAEPQANCTLSLAISELGPGSHVVFVLRPIEQLSVKKLRKH